LFGHFLLVVVVVVVVVVVGKNLNRSVNHK
jgi:hypothetical protein